MKIFLDNVANNNTGPNTFARRLAHQFVCMGHTLADHDDYDVQLAFIEARCEPLPGKPLVQRLDGIWFKPQEFEAKNTWIRMTWQVASAVVWQSDFDRKMTTHHWGQKNGVVINNGIDLSHKITQHNIPEIKTLRDKYDHFFVCSSNWHPQKRLTQNVELFKHVRKNLPGRSCLVVMGQGVQHKIADHDVFYTDTVPEDVYLEVYSSADWMIHLAWLDHCPNVICECLSQETPVICSSSGGTKELVQEFGIILEENTSYNYELADYDNPPDIDVTDLDVNLLLRKPLKQHADVDIHNVAKRYISLFETLLC